MKGLSTFFAKRYLFSKKSHTLINVISIISSLSIAIPVASIIILLSIYGGLISIVEDLNSTFDPEIKVTSDTRGFFAPDSALQTINDIEGIAFVSPYIEDGAVAEYETNRAVVTIRGIDSLYSSVVDIEQMIRAGEYKLTLGDLDYAIVGAGIGYNLRVNTNLSKALRIYAPTRQKRTFLPTPPLKEESLFPSATFAIDAQTDATYILVPFRFAEKLFDRKGKVSAIAVGTENNTQIEKVKEELRLRLGENYIVEDRYEQKQTLYNIMESEKRVIFIVSFLIMAIASFTLVGSLIMLMTDKRQEIEILKVMGATEKFIRDIFVKQGLMITLASLFVGTIIGVTFVALQHYFGFITIDSQTLIIDSYPVRLSFSDVAMVVGGVGFINMIIIYITVVRR